MGSPRFSASEYCRRHRRLLLALKFGRSGNAVVCCIPSAAIAVDICVSEIFPDDVIRFHPVVFSSRRLITFKSGGRGIL